MPSGKATIPVTMASWTGPTMPCQMPELAAPVLEKPWVVRKSEPLA